MLRDGNEAGARARGSARHFRAVREVCRNSRAERLGFICECGWKESHGSCSISVCQNHVQFQLPTNFSISYARFNFTIIYLVSSLESFLCSKALAIGIKISRRRVYVFILDLYDMVSFLYYIQIMPFSGEKLFSNIN